MIFSYFLFRLFGITIIFICSFQLSTEHFLDILEIYRFPIVYYGFD